MDLNEEIWYIEYDHITLTSGQYSEDILLDIGKEFSGEKKIEKLI